MAVKIVSIEMNKSVSGATAYHSGRRYEVSETIAKDLMQAGFAIAVKGKKAEIESPQTPETDGGSA